MSKFTGQYNNYIGVAGFALWCFLIILHIFAIYALWGSSLSMIWLVIMVFASHAIYALLILGKDNEQR